MPSLVIPEAGLSLDNFAARSSKHASPPTTALGLALTDDMIEDMIRCVQDGQPIQLSLGEHPTLSFGGFQQQLSSSHDPFTHEIYKTTNSSSKTATMVSSGHLAMFGIKPGTKAAAAFAANSKKIADSVHTTIINSRNETVSKPQDAALAALQNSMASENQKKAENTTKIINGPVSKRGPNSKSKFLNRPSLGSDASRSMPASPALSGVGSPSLGPTSVPLSQQQAESAKAIRKPIIHELAVGPMTESAVYDKISGFEQHELRLALEKVGALNETTGKWELRRNYFRDLDVWTYKYQPSEDRQRAIDAAVSQYDKLRLGASEPEWDKLLIKSERGTGKCLSKLQARIVAQASAKAAKEAEEAEMSAADKKVSSLKKSDAAGRSVSQPPATKNKKASEKEAQAKRLLSTKPPKASTSKPSTPKPATKPGPKAAPKTAPRAASKAAATKKAAVPKAGAKVLSSEFVNDSDEEDTPAPVRPKPRVLTKRPRPDDMDTSDSSIPLSKKVKKDAGPQHRISNGNPSSQNTTSSLSSFGNANKKNSSPQKSSPLASSPPTNASEFESTGNRSSASTTPSYPSTSTKNARSPIHKRHQKSSSIASSVSSASSQRYLTSDVMMSARQFKMYYPKYKALYEELAAMGGRRDLDKEADLLEMHNRLAKYKSDVMAGIVTIDPGSSPESC